MIFRSNLMAIIGVVAGTVVLASPADAGLSRSSEKSAATDTSKTVVDVDGAPNKWSGRWRSATGSTLTIHNDGAFLEIFGADGFSNFQLHCLPDQKLTSRVLICVGHGRQLTGIPFTYQSRLTLGETGDLTENWTATALDKSKAKITKISSEETFTKTSSASE